MTNSDGYTLHILVHMGVIGGMRRGCVEDEVEMMKGIK